jgi:DNA repair protein RecN (Recombination protein N)
MIFDEVDVGIGGGVAETIGLLLKSLGHVQNKQVFVITHLPQVAAQSTNHFKVSKITKNDETLSQIVLLNEDSRLEEVARMLGGLAISEKTRAHAKELLG